MIPKTKRVRLKGKAAKAFYDKIYERDNGTCVWCGGHVEYGVKFDAHFNLTTVDPPEVVRFVKQNHPEVTIEKPRISMRKLIEKRGYCLRG